MEFTGAEDGGMATQPAPDTDTEPNDSSGDASPAAVPADAPRLMVQSGTGEYRPATPEEVLKVARRLLARRVRRGMSASSPQRIKDHLQMQIGALEHEVFCVVFLDTSHRWITSKVLFRGTVTQSSIYPREVVKESLALNAGAVILAHNHPSASSMPTEADRELTRALTTVLSMVDIRVLDHMVVTRHGVFSFAENGLL